MGAVLERRNIRDSKRFFSDINRKAQEGQEIITFDGLRPNQSEVSHIKTEVLDKLLSAFRFNPEWVFDDELSMWTVSFTDLPVYGEGSTKEEAEEELVDSLLEYVDVYYANLTWFLSREETAYDLRYVRQIARCEGDRKRIRNLIGFEYAR